MSARRTAFHFPDCPGKGCDCPARAQRLLAEYEDLSCDCEFAWSWDSVKREWHLQPCEHIKTLMPHRLSLEKWTALLLQLAPGQHAEPKAIPLPELKKIRRPDRIDIYSERIASGQQLYHPKDRWRKQPVDVTDRLGQQARHCPNGADDESAPVVEEG